MSGFHFTMKEEVCLGGRHSGQIFKDPLTTAAAIDRVVHHSLIIEFGREMKSVRAEEAARRNGIRLGGSDAAQDVEC